MTDTFTADEIEVFSQARAVAGGRRISYDQWLMLGEAVEISWRHSSEGGDDGTKRRAIRFHTILKTQELGWLVLTNRRTIHYLRAVMANRSAVDRWRSALSDAEKIKWSSPHAIFDRCPAFGQTAKRPVVKAKPMTLAEFLRLPASDAATLLHMRCPAKFFAIMRAMQEIAEAGSVKKPQSGWAMDRERTAGAGAAAA